jgi:hypothetical protein
MFRWLRAHTFRALMVEPTRRMRRERSLEIGPGHARIMWRNIMTTKSPRPTSSPGTVPTPTAEEIRLRRMRASEAQETLDKRAAATHPLKGDVDRAGFDLGGVDGEPMDAGLREVETPIDK